MGLQVGPTLSTGLSVYWFVIGLPTSAEATLRGIPNQQRIWNTH